MRLHPKRRRGFALVIILIEMAIVSIVLVTIAAQIRMNRQMVERREQQLQSLWLARSGMEVARVRLADDADYDGEELQLLPHSELRIAVESDTITVEASYATEDRAGTVNRTIERRRQR